MRVSKKKKMLLTFNSADLHCLFNKVSHLMRFLTSLLLRFLGKDNVEQDFTISQPTYYRGCKSTEGMLLHSLNLNYSNKSNC